MARYQKAPDLWDAGTREALDAGRLTLQPGQWVRLGDNPRPSRFYRHNPATGHVLAFHPDHSRRGVATRKMREYLGRVGQ